jgi:hypothetical protein
VGLPLLRPFRFFLKTAGVACPEDLFDRVIPTSLVTRDHEFCLVTLEGVPAQWAESVVTLVTVERLVEENRCARNVPGSQFFGLLGFLDDDPLTEGDAFVADVDAAGAGDQPVDALLVLSAKGASLGDLGASEDDTALNSVGISAVRAVPSHLAEPVQA